MPTKSVSDIHPKVAPDAPDTAAGPPGPGKGPEEEGLDRVEEVHTRVLDTKNGFQTMIEKAEPDFVPIAQAFYDMHARHERDLAVYLSKAGRDPQDNGSFFGAVNKAAVELRSWFTGIDHSSMEQVKEGEKHVLEAYHQARNSAQSVEANALLLRHAEEIDRLMSEHAN